VCVQHGGAVPDGDVYTFQTADSLGLNKPSNIAIIYLGFGAGLAVFMFCGFVKSIPLEIEEAAMIDGCNPVQTYFRIVFPIFKPTMISVAILEAMWVWNDYLLPTLVLDIKKYRTIPMLIQYFRQLRPRGDGPHDGLHHAHGAAHHHSVSGVPEVYHRGRRGRGGERLMRTSGILMPVSSLPSPYGIGSLGRKPTVLWIFLAAAGQRYWQICPSGPRVTATARTRAFRPLRPPLFHRPRRAGAARPADARRDRTL
jgi:hypothetical protein